MLYTHKLLAELEAKAERLAGFQDDYGRRLEAYRAALAALGARYPTASTLARAQRELLADESAGAAPTAEYDTWRARGAGGAPLLPFGMAFAHHAEARAWAEGLRGVTTFAVDGSQLLPWRDASVPLALVQVGIFENPHQPPAPYTKDIMLELLTPDDLLGGGRPDPAAGTDDGSGLADDDAPGGAQIASEETVHLRRFQLEARAIVERMERHAQRDGSGDGSGDGGLVVGLLDGSLIVSFALKMSPAYRAAYVSAARSLLEASARCRVPLVAYIDTSYARDVVGMLRHLAPDALPDVAGPPLPAPRGIHDALLWQGALAWGDRTPAFLSARGDVLAGGYGEAKGDIAFVYLQTALDRPPARLEFPRWVLEAGLLDRVMDAVRAEVIAGNGYPYPLEAADAVAVIALADRAQFYQIFQRFAQQRGLAFSFSRKALSKSRRRV